MSNSNIDDILNSGDEAAIEAALENMDLETGELFDNGEQSEETDVAEQPEEAEQSEQEAQSEAEKTEQPDSSTTEETKPGYIEKDGKLYAEITAENAVIDSKNGKHHVPYDVLNAARQEAQRVKAALEAERQAKAQLEADAAEAKRVAELYSKQLSEAGLDPRKLPEQMLNDPELMAQVKEDYPQIGELVEALAAQVAATKQATQNVQQAEQSQQTASDPLIDALNQTTHLKQWQESDPDKWEMAKIIDDKLSNDPSFANKPLNERLLEVEKRVASAFGEQVEQPQQPKAQTQQKLKAPIPNTPTDIGVQGNDKSGFSHILDQDAGNMTAQMQSMTDAQIEALLADASDFL